VRRAPLQRPQRRAAQRREAAPPATQKRSLKRIRSFTSAETTHALLMTRTAIC
jgi:hypothetical protein